MQELPNLSLYSFLGEYNGIREFRRNAKYFMSTFVDPESFRFDSLRNNQNYIIVGRKGTGKSSCVMAFSENLRLKGFQTTLLSFNDELTPDDIRQMAKSQDIKLGDYASAGKLYDSISALYDFREIWKKQVILSIAEQHRRQNPSSLFAKFCLTQFPISDKIDAGLKKGGIVSLVEPLLPKAKEILDLILSNRKSSEIPLKAFNETALRLALEESVQHYFFFDELNVTHLKTKSDEFELRMALVRDIVKASTELNDWFCAKSMGIHIVCSLRPEVRDRLTKDDPELSQSIDSCYVELSWAGKVTKDHALIRILQRKLKEGCPIPVSEEESLYAENVKSMDTSGELQSHLYMLNLSWFRPRDMVRIIKCFQKTNGHCKRLLSPNGDITKFLKEYSRISSGEVLAELSVKHGDDIVSQIKNRLNRRYYSNLDELHSHLSILENRVDVPELISDLYHSGVILNYDKTDGKTEFYAAYRGDDRLEDDMQVMIHRGLWNSFHLFRTQ